MRHAGLALAVLPLLLLPPTGCVKSRPLLARNAFASSYWCPVNRIEVRAEPGSDRLYSVTGCGLQLTYDCGDDADARGCQAHERVGFEATDGTSRDGSEEEEANHGLSREAALASAAHDLPCDRASIQVVGADPNGFANVLEGCGQRVTYQIADVAEPPSATPSEPVKKHKYVVIHRAAVAAAPAPPASAAPAHSASAPAPATSSPLSTPR
jgi:hypothetical protein